MVKARNVILLMVLLVGGCDRPAVPVEDSIDLKIGGRVFTLEVASDNESRIQGLSDREEIADDGGMLFIFTDSKVRRFVMRRCLVPIDILFLDSKGYVVGLHAMIVEPYETKEMDLKVYESRWPAMFAVELKGGKIDELGLKEGDFIEADWQGLQAIAR